jgi:hypothetical protein
LENAVLNRRSGSRGFAALLALSCSGAGDTGAAVVIINPGDDVQRIVDANPAGTTYKFRAGIYREDSVRPKLGDIYEGEPGTILSGARLLTGWVAEGVDRT